MAEKGAYSPLFASEGNSNNSKYVPLNSSVEDAGEANSKRKFVTGRRKYFLAGFISILVVSVVTVAAVLGTKSGRLVSPSYCKVYFNSRDFVKIDNHKSLD